MVRPMEGAILQGLQNVLLHSGWESAQIARSFWKSGLLIVSALRPISLCLSPLTTRLPNQTATNCHLDPYHCSMPRGRSQFRPTCPTRTSTGLPAQTGTHSTSSISNTALQKSALKNGPTAQPLKDSTINAVSQSNNVRPFLDVRE